MDVIQIITALTTLIGLVASVLYARRAKKAEVRAKEIENARDNIGNADLMIELVKKANAEAGKVQQNMIDALKFENEKFKGNVDRLERAFRAINRCPYRDDCPVYAELQNCKGSVRQTVIPNGNGPGNHS